MCPSPRRRRVLTGLPVVVVLAGMASGTAAIAKDAPVGTRTGPSPGATATSLEGLSAPVRDIVLPPGRDIVTTVRSMDGTEEQRDTDTRRTVVLDSSVLFAEDRAEVTPAARVRLRSVARQIIEGDATGVVRIDGFTDDQGSAEHGLVLSRQRADAVRRVLKPLLGGVDVRLVTRGFGEAHPRLPNADKAGNPLPKNQAKNRRVEITFSRTPGD